MRLLLLHACYPTPSRPELVGGAEVSVPILAEGLAERGHEVTVVRGLPPGQPERTEQIGNVTVHALPISRPYWMFDGKSRSAPKRAIWHLLEDMGLPPRAFARIVREVKPEAALSQNIVGLGWQTLRVLKKFGIPVVQTFRDYYFTCPYVGRFREGSPCGKTCTSCRLFTTQRRRAERHTDAVVGVSRETLNVHLRCGFFREVPVKTAIHNGVEVAPAEHERNWPETRFGFLGRVAPEKGLDLLVQAFGTLPTGTRLLVAGRIDEEEKERLGRLAGRPVEFLGFMPQEEFFQQIDVLVVPSLWAEPFARVSIEAQASGVPCIVSDRGALPETIGHGESGWIFKPEREGELAELMGRLAAKKGEIAAKGARTREVASRFSFDRYVGAYDTLLRRLRDAA